MSMKKIVILTGAGISAESGVPTFRDAGGLWEGHSVGDVATPAAFRRNPELVHRFYNQRRSDLKSRQPNPAHIAIAKLQQAYPDNVTLVTQNVDDLHERGGSPQILHLHGELRKIRCEFCLKPSDWFDDLSVHTTCPKCQRASFLRPHIVWFGEVPFGLEHIEQALENVEIFAAIGTSGLVYPAASFVDAASCNDAHTIEFNVKETTASARFDEIRTGPASLTVVEWVDELLR